ncbi:MAG TPA: hypothetical protein VGM90_32800 [Kofleriaceae bacterium]|jgi:hypothetical protein
MKLASLFTPPTFKRVSLAREMDAVRSGKKPLAFYTSDRASLEDGSDLIDTMKAAFDRELSIALLPQHGDATSVIIFRAEQSRRVGAFHSFIVEKRKTGWTFTAENQMSRLLGYSKVHRAEWMRRERASHIGYGMVTVYAIATVGFDHLFTGTGAVYPRARARLPRGAKLLRFGIDSQTHAKLFKRGRAVEVELTKSRRKVFIDGTLAGPEVLGPRGWSAVR